MPYSANAIVKEASPFGYWLCRLFFAREQTAILYKAYSYFRQVDNIVDHPNISPYAACEFTARQESLCHLWYAGKEALPRCQLEDWLYETIYYDRKSSSYLKPMIQLFLTAIVWDSKRRFHIVSQSELDNYSFCLGYAYSIGLLFGLGLDPTTPDYQIPMKLCGTASHLVHLLRDFFADIELGYINISRQHAEQFQVDFLRLNLQNLREWALSQCKHARTLFSQGRSERSNLPTRKARLMFDLVCFRYLITLKQTEKFWINLQVLPQKVNLSQNFTQVGPPAPT